MPRQTCSGASQHVGTSQGAPSMQVAQLLSSRKFQPWWWRPANSPLGGTHTTCCWKAARAVGKTDWDKGTFHPVMRAGPTDKCLLSKDLEKISFPWGLITGPLEGKKNLIMGVTGQHRTSRFDFSPLSKERPHCSILGGPTPHPELAGATGAFVPWVPPCGPPRFPRGSLFYLPSLLTPGICADSERA